MLEFWEISSDVHSMWVQLPPKCDRTVMLHWSCYEGSARALHPAARGDTGFIVQQEVLEDFLALNPALPQVTSGEEYGH